MDLLLISLAPVITIIIYVYYRDKYEKEPWRMLARALLLGIIIIVPVIAIERFLELFTPQNQISSAAYTAFVIAGFTEESFKYLAFVLFIWGKSFFNEKFDGIVYAVYISLGFAGVENIMYVLDGGFETGVIRAVTAVPAHALFGVTMGYYLGLAKFYSHKKKRYLFLAWFVPVAFHGFYNFCLMAQFYALLLVLIPFIIFLWINGFRKMKELSDSSIYRNKLF